MASPFIPHISEGLHAILGYTQPLFGGQRTEVLTDALGTHTALRYEPEEGLAREGVDLWQPLTLEANRPFNQPVPLVKKLDHSIVEAERARLGQQ